MVAGNHEILLIGISGKMGHGKDSLATALFHRIHQDDRFQDPENPVVMFRPFAQSLKEEVARFIAPVVSESRDRLMPITAAEIEQQLNSHIPSRKAPFRLLLQWWGTEFRRNHCGEDYWLRRHEEAVFAFALGCRGDGPIAVLIPDVRFPGEAEYVRQRGGLLIRVQRPGVVEESAHASETALDDWWDWDSVLVNDGTLAFLQGRAGALYDAIIKDRLQCPPVVSGHDR